MCVYAHMSVLHNVHMSHDIITHKPQHQDLTSSLNCLVGHAKVCVSGSNQTHQCASVCKPSHICTYSILI